MAKKQIEKNQKRMLTIIAGIALILGILSILMYSVSNKNKKMLQTDQELARAMNYGQFVEEDENIEGTDNVKFSAFFLRDINGDGKAEKIKGTCKEVGKEDTLYMELNVLTVGYLKDAKIQVNGENFYFQTALPKDEQLKENYIGNNIKEISFNNINNGTQKLLTGVVRTGDYSYTSKKTEAIGNDITKYSKNNQIILTGTYVNENNEEIQITKTVDLQVDWYGTTKAEIPSYVLGRYNINQSKDNTDILDKENREVNLNFELITTETNGSLNLKSSNLQGEIPELNGYAPKRVEITGTNVTYEYDETTRIFTAKREAILDENNKIITQCYDGIANNAGNRYNKYTIKITYPIEAYQAIGADTVEIKIPVETYYEGYNNQNKEFSNPYKSNIAKNTIVVTYSEPAGDVAIFKVRVGRYTSLGRYIVSKEKPLRIYNGLSEQEQKDTYIVTWTGSTGSDGNSKGMTMKETANGSAQIVDQFIKADSSVSSMSEVTTNTGIYFSSQVSVLGEEGWIKVYNDETGELIETFTKDNWNKYTSKNPYQYAIPVKHIRIQTSETKANSSLIVYNVKTLDDEYITENYTKEEFDNLKYIKSTLTGYLGEVTINTDTHQALYQAPYSTAEVSLNKTAISTQATEKNVEIKIEAIGDEFENQAKWVNGAFLLKIPKNIVDVEINNVKIDNSSVKIISYELYEEEGTNYIKIITENENKTTYNITIDCNMTPDPRIATVTEPIELYASNENVTEYSNPTDDIYDVNGNLNKTEKVDKEIANISLISPNSLLTNQTAANFDSKGSIVIAPKVAQVLKSQRSATVNIEINNNYTSTISDVKMLGRVPYEGNKYVINESDMGSNFTVTMSDTGIQLPEELKEIAKVYYSENGEATKDLILEGNGWTTTPEDFSKIKSYMIDLGDYKISKGNKYQLSYEINIPEGLNYNQISYSHHAIYFSLDTPEGKYETKTEPNKIGFMIGKQYDLELMKYQKNKEKLVEGATYLIKEKGAEEGKTKVTNENGTLNLEGLYIEKIYTIKEIKSPSEYELNGEKIEFTTRETNGQLEVIKNNGTVKNIKAIQPQEEEDYKVQVQVEDEVKAKLKITKLQKDTEIKVSKVKYKITGTELPESGRGLITNINGETTISGLKIGEEYTLEEVKAEGYYLTSPIKFIITNENGTYKANITEGTVKANKITEENEIPTINLEIEDEKIPTYTLEVEKIKNGTKVDTVEGTTEQTEILEGAKFELYKQNKKIGTYETNSEGKIIIDNLYQYEQEKDINQTYTLKEIMAPTGYAKVKDITFKVQKVNGKLEFKEELEDGQAAKKYTVEGDTIKLIIEDSEIFKLVKKDAETKRPIANVKFAIYNVDQGEQPAKNSKGEIIGKREIIDGKEYYTLSTNENGEITADLIEGLYKAVEVQAPEKYDISNGIHYFGIGTSREGKSNLIAKWGNLASQSDQKANYYHSVAEMSDGGYVVIGSFENKELDLGNEIIIKNQGNYDGMIIKYNEEGIAQWAKVIGGFEYDEISSISETNDGGFIIGGNFRSSSIDLGNGRYLNNIGDMDGMVIKYDANGEVEWEKVIGGYGYDEIKSVSETVNGDYIVGGNFYSDEVDLGNGVILKNQCEDNCSDVMLIKYNSKGETLWTGTIGGNDSEEIKAVKGTKDGGFIIGGFFHSNEINLENGMILKNHSTENADGMIIKYDQEGEIEWANSVGGNEYDEISSIAETTDEEYVAVAYISGEVNLENGEVLGNNTNGCAIIIRYTKSGKIKTSTYIESDNSLDINSVSATKDGGYILGVDFSGNINIEGVGNSNTNNGLIIKYSKEDTIDCVRHIVWDRLNSVGLVIETNDGDYIAVGAFFDRKFDLGNDVILTAKTDSYNPMIAKFTLKQVPEIIVKDAKSIGGSGNGNEGILSISETTDGGYIAGGYFNDSIDLGDGIVLNSNGEQNGMVIKYSQEGKVQWAKVIGGNYTNDSITSVTETNDGGYIVGGSFYSKNIILENGETIVNKGSYDGIIIKYNKDGALEWVKQVGGKGGDKISAISKTSDEGFITVGTFYQSITLENGETLNARGSRDGMVLKYNKDGEVQWAKVIGGESNNEDINSVSETIDGKYVIVGSFYSKVIELENNVILTRKSSQYMDGMIIVYNQEGNLEWAKSLEASSINTVSGTSDGGYIVGGTIRTNTSVGVQFDLENKIILTHGWDDGILIKYKGEEVQWAKAIGGNGHENINSVSETNDGGCIIGGNITSKNIDFGSGVVLNRADSDRDGVIVKYDKEGEAEWKKSIGGSNSDSIKSIVETEDGMYISGGNFNSSSIDLGNEKILNNNGGYDGMIIKLAAELGVPEVQEIKAENNIKRFKITTEVKMIDGTRGGNITGEKLYPYEKVKYQENSTKEIKMTPDENYEIIGITVNGVDYPYTLNEDGTYVMPQFENVTEDKHVVVTYSKTENKITINKVDSENPETKLPGATFEIKQIDESIEESNLYKTTITTNSEGQAITQIPFGKYQITETKEPEGYEKLENPIIVEFTATGNSVVTNENKINAIVNSDGEFVIENNEKAKVIVHHYIKGTTTKVAEDELLEGKSEEKYSTSPKLDLPKYELEKDTEGQYILPENAIGTFTPGTQEVTYYYVEKEIPLTVHHYIEGSNQLVPLKDGTEAKDQTDSGKEGEEYTSNPILDTELDEKYELVEIPENSKGTYNGDEVIVTYYYKLIERKLILQKYQEDGETPLEGAKFTITEKEQENDGTIYTTNAQGKIEVDLKAGTYIITETEAPDGYQLPENPSQEIVISRNTTTEQITLSNTKQRGNVIVHHYIKDTTTKVPSKEDGKVVEDENKTGIVGEIYVTKSSEDISEKYELVQTPENASGTITKETTEVVYYYELKEAQVIVHHYIQGTTEKLSDDKTINGRIDEEYETNVAEDIPANYELVEEPNNKNGTMTLDTITVTYYYKLKIPEITSKIDKTTKTIKVIEARQAIDYTINYQATIDKYIGDATVTITDKLPYAIDEAKSNKAGGTYNPEDQTITWTETINNIDTFANGIESINITKEISLVYSNLDVTKTNVTNTATGRIVLETPEKEETKETTKEIPTEYLINVPVTKVWEDNNNEAEKRPTSVTVTINGDTDTKQEGNEVNQEYELTAEADWKHTFNNLPKYNELGNEVVYTVTEKETGSIYYTTANTKVTGNQEEGFVITNKFEVPGETVSVPVTKVWEDNNNEAEKRPEAVTVIMTGDTNTKQEGNEVNQEYELTAEADWRHTFNNLPKYNNLGNEVVYTVTEKETGSIYYTTENTEVTGNQKEGFVVTNKFEVPGETVSVSVTKVWEDNNNEAEKRPTSVTVTINGDTNTKQEGNEVNQEYELTAEADWRHTFNNLPKYNNLGNEVVYTVTEKETGSIYYTTENTEVTGNQKEGFVITNKFEVPEETVSVPVTKVWEDNNNEAEKRPTSVTVTINGDTNTKQEGNEVKQEHELTANTDWKHTFESLPKYNNLGNEVVYTITEKETGSIYYTTANTKVTGNQKEGFVITNKFEVPEETVSVPVTKVWDDNNNEAEKRPENVTVEVKSEEKVVAEKALTQEENWKHTFNNLPKYNGLGNEVVYSVTEKETGNIFYTTANTKVTGNQKEGFVITNKFEVPEETVSVPVTKVWDDNNNEAEKRPENVTVEVKSEEKVVVEKILTQEENWRHTFNNLPKYDNLGNEVVYSVTEKETGSIYYTTENTEVTGNQKEGFVVTNKFEVPGETVSVSVTKVWEDNNNEAEKRPTSVTVTINGDTDTKQEGNEVNQEYELTAEADWKHTFNNLPKYNELGNEVVYTVTEKETGSIFYTTANTKVTGNQKEGFVVTNKFEVPGETVSVPVTKVWEDNNNEAEKRPEAVTVIITGDTNTKQEGNEVKQEHELIAEADWKHTFNNLPKYNNLGNEVVYSVTEKETGSIYYTTANTKVTGNQEEGFVITNKFEVPGETVSVPVTKVWEDNNNEAGKRPENVTVEVKCEEKVVAEKVLTQEENWKHIFNNLPKYDNLGDEVVYSITEKQTGSIYYTTANTKVTGNQKEGFVITNKFEVPGETISVPVTKVWEDNNNEAEKRPTSVTVTINGDTNTKQEGNEVKQEHELTAEEDWRHTFSSLPKYNDLGNEVVYSVIEKETGSIFYTTANTKVTGNQEEGFVITNKFEVPSDTINVPVTKIWNHQNNIYEKPTQIKVLLKNGNTIVKEQTINNTNKQETDENTWKYTFTDVPKYNNMGNEINYTIEEVEVKEGDLEYYTSKVNGLTIENKYKGPIISAVKAMTTEREKDFVIEGEKITYTITVENEGGVAKDVIIKDTIPEGTNLVNGSIKVNGKATHTTLKGEEQNLSTKTETDLRNGITVKVPEKIEETKGKATLSFEVTVSKEATGDIRNKATVDKNDTNEVKIPMLCYEKTSRIIKKNVDVQTKQNEVTVGDSIYYTIKVTNTGSEDVHNIKVRDRAPEGTNAKNVKEQDKDMEWTIEEIKAGESKEVGYEAEVLYTNKNFIIKNVATVEEKETNETEDPYIEPQTTLTSNIVKTGTNKVTAKDEKVYYEVNFTSRVNYFVGKAKITLTDTLPYPIDEEKSVLNGGKYNAENQTITWEQEEKIDTMKTQDAKEIEITKQFQVSYIYGNLDEILSEASNKTMVNTINSKIELQKPNEENPSEYNKVKEDTKEAEKETTIEIPAQVIVHHYIEGTERKVPSNEEGKVVGDERIEGKIGESYNTKASEKISSNYKCINENPEKHQGKMKEETIEVIYYYRLETPTVTNKIEKTAQVENNTEQEDITLRKEDGKVKYTIKYTSEIDGYIGKGTIKIVDKLPAKIDVEKSNIKNGKYDEETLTITWLEEIEKIDTYKNGKYTKETTKEIELVYKEQDVTKDLDNQVKGETITYYPEEVETNPGEEFIKEEATDEAKVKQEYKTEFIFNKTWDDSENIKQKRPESVQIKIVQNETGKKSTIELNEENNWTTKAGPLTKYNETGEKYTYEVTEQETNEKDLEFYEEPEIKLIESQDEEKTTYTYNITNTYKLLETDLRGKISKTGTEEITASDEKVEYEIHYEAEMQRYIGGGKVRVIDTLPYAIDEEKSELDGGKYNEEEKTITWEEELSHINTEETKQSYKIDISKNISLVYKDLDATQEKITNKVEGRTILYETEQKDEKETTYETKINIKGKVIVKYVNKETGEIIVVEEEPYTYEIIDKVGKDYVTEEKEIENYEFVESTNNETGKIKQEEQEVIYYYTRKETTVLVKYQDRDGNELAEEEVIKGKIGDKYKTEEKDIENYKLYSVTENKEGTMEKDQIIVIYVYEKIPTKVIVKHLEKGTNKELHEEETIEGVAGDNYKTERKVIENYQAAEPEPENANGKMEKDEIEVIYYYEKIPSGEITVKYIDIDTNEEITYTKTNENGSTQETTYKYQIKGKVGDKYQTEQKQIPYYNYVKSTENTEGELTQNNDTVIYYYQKQVFNLKVDKWVSEVEVNGETKRARNIGTKDQIYKLEIHRKKVKTTNIKIKYKIRITNTGEIEGTVGEIIEQIPEQYTFYQEDNQIKWTKEGKNLITEDLREQTIKPGEYKEIEIVLRWETGENNIGQKDNKVSIRKMKNPAGYEDKEAEDNQSTSTMIIAVATGMRDNTIETVVESLVSCIITGIGVYLILVRKTHN